MRLKHAAEPSLDRSFLHWAVPCFVAFLAACSSASPEARRDDAWVVILPREPEQLDPRYASDAYGIKLTRLIHRSLVRMDPISLEAVPDLAERIELESPTSYRVRLREGLRFSDGSSFDADDVVATFRALVSSDVKSRWASTYRRVRRVEALGEHDVRFELDAPHATFFTDLEVPVLRAEDAFQRPDADRPPIGAGAYRLARRSTGHIELAPNPHHPAASGSGLRTLHFVVIRDDNTRALRMLAGAADLALNAVPPLLVPMFEGNPEFRVESAPGIGTTYLGVNLLHPVLRDLRVRRALAHAIDREGLVRYKLNGRARLARSFIPPGHWAYASDTPSYGHDERAAEELLDQAGFQKDEHGVRLRLTLRTSSDRFVVSTARALSAMLAKVGVDLDVRPSEGATLLADLARGRFELTYLQIPEVFEPHVLYWFFGSDRIPEPGVREGANRWRFVNSELDRALEDGRVHVAREERIRAYRAVQGVLARELPVIPLFHEDVVAITSARLSGYRVPRDARFATLVMQGVAR